MDARELIELVAEKVAVHSRLVTIADKLRVWKALYLALKAVEEEIQAEVLAIRQSIEADGVRATYGKGRSKIDWEAICDEAKLRIDPKTFRDVVARHTTPRVNWRAVAKELGFAEDEVLVQQYTAPGKPYVSIKLKEEK